MLTLEQVIKAKETTLKENVSKDNPFLKEGIRLWLDNPTAKHLIVSLKPSKELGYNEEVQVNKLAFSDSEFDQIIKNLYNNWNNKIASISAFHNIRELEYYPEYKEVLKEKEEKEENINADGKNVENTESTVNTSGPAESQNIKTEEPKNAKLNKARQNNSKIIKAFKEVGLDITDLTVKAQNKNGKEYTKASDKLNKLRKTLFGEEFDPFLEDIELSKKDLEEDVEIHSTLNPKLFDENNELLPEVKEKAQQIVDKFIEYVNNKDIEIKVKDIVLLGSNANYNYNDDSDFDLHIIVDDSMDCSEKHLLVIYDALKSLFNDKYDITINGINVEIYVENEYKDPSFSGGIYSLNKGWINEPSVSKIPEIDNKDLNKKLKPWIIKYLKIVKSNNSEEIDKFIDDIHDMRKDSIVKEGEFGIGNLVFKEFRRMGYLDNLKKLKDNLVSKELSL